MQLFQYCDKSNRIEKKSDKETNHIKIMNGFLAELGDPQKKLKNIIHVAGTNGKGSVCNFIKTGLEKSGYSVNLYTSPHLCKINERIRIKGKLISTLNLKKLDSFIGEKFNNTGITFFEAVTIAAILAFEKDRADFNIFEVGLGGRLDATNIFDYKLLSILTSISNDHNDILGGTLEKIAFEKVSILEEKGEIFSVSQNNSALSIIENMIRNKNAEGYFEGKNWEILNKKGDDFFYSEGNFKMKLSPSLKGRHQIQNAAISIAVLNFIKRKGYEKITNKTIKKGIENTYWPGRIQEIKADKIRSTMILDGAHNQDGIKNFMNYIKKTKDLYEKNFGFYTSLSNRKIEDFMPDLKDGFEKIYILDFPENRIKDHKFHDAKELSVIFQKEGISFEILKFRNLDSFIKKNLNKKKYRIAFFGSLYLIGEILKKYAKAKIR